MKKKFALGLVLLLVCALAGVFANGAAEQGTAVAATKPTEIQFWTWRPEDVDFYNSVIANFEKLNPGITVVQNAIKNTEYNTVLSASLSGGSGPDVFQARAYGGLFSLSQSGFLEPIEKWVPSVKNFPEAALASATDQGTIWGVPAVGQTMLVYYNTDMYKKYGLQIPQTWDEFLHNCQVLKDNGELAIANGTKEGWTVETLLGVVGPTFYGGDDFYNAVVAGKTTFEDPRFIGAIKKIGELKPYLPEMHTGVSYTDMQSNFINELAGHFLGGSYEASYFEAQNPDLHFDVFAMPGLKSSDPKRVSVYADMSWAINANSTKKEAAAKFVNYLASVEISNRIISEMKMVSWTPGTDSTKTPFIQKVLKLQENSTPYIFLAGFRFKQPTGSQLFQAAGQGFMAGQLTAEEVAASVQKGIATYYEPFQNK
jgi:raffinose/stachyose/melibiose transport system substrate-binding protein